MNFLENFIMSIDWYDPQNGIRINHVIFRKDNIVFILIDDAGKVKDVSYMPSYIQDDYVKYRSREIEESDINKLVSKLEWWCGFGNDETQGQMPTSEKYDEYMEKIGILKNIKRDIKIKKLLS